MNEDKVIESLEWRYSVKKFDPNKKLSKAQINLIEKTLILSPSSYGLQPWHFVLIHDQKIKDKLLPHAFNQSQIKDAHLIVILCTPKQLTEEFIEKYVKQVSNVRGVSINSLEKFREMLLNVVENKSEKELEVWMTNQVYIALGMLLMACASAKIDACPIGGFSKKDFDKILELDKRGLKSKIVCAVGFRDQSDKYISRKKVRFDRNDVITFI